MFSAAGLGLSIFPLILFSSLPLKPRGFGQDRFLVSSTDFVVNSLMQGFPFWVGFVPA